MAPRDQVVEAIGNIGKWQWMIILPLAFREIFTSWQMLSPPFLAMEPSNFFCSEAGMENFETLQKWQEFANVKNGEKIDKCHVYNLDYSNINFNNTKIGSQLTNQSRPCQKWIFLEDEVSTLITDFE